MMRRKLFGLVIFGVTIGLSAWLPIAFANPPAKDPIKIGLVKAFFNDIPDPYIDIAVQPFGDVMKKTTGLDGTLTYKDQAFALAEKLNNNELNLAVFHGHEFAWVHKKYPALTPLLIAVNSHRDVRAFIVVHQNNPAKTIAELRSKKFDLPMGTKEHCLVYLNRHCGDNAQNEPKAFFSDVSRSKSPLYALDDVCRGNVQAAIVDTITLEHYKYEKKSVYEKNLRVLAQSDSFPQPVIVYKEGALDAKFLEKFREGLYKAHTIPAGADMMKMWQIDAFVPVPKDYSESLARVRKEYPSPEPSKVSMR